MVLIRARWQERFDELMGGAGGYFVRAEPRCTARKHVAGLLSGAERRTAGGFLRRPGVAARRVQQLLRMAVGRRGGPDDVRCPGRAGATGIGDVGCDAVLHGFTR